MEFVKIGHIVVNLATVLYAYKPAGSHSIKLVFRDGHYLEFDSAVSGSGYQELSVWMDEQQTLLHD